MKIYLLLCGLLIVSVSCAPVQVPMVGSSGTFMMPLDFGSSSGISEKAKSKSPRSNSLASGPINNGLNGGAAMLADIMTNNVVSPMMQTGNMMIAMPDLANANINGNGQSFPMSGNNVNTLGPAYGPSPSAGRPNNAPIMNSHAPMPETGNNALGNSVMFLGGSTNGFSNNNKFTPSNGNTLNNVAVSSNHAFPKNNAFGNNNIGSNNNALRNNNFISNNNPFGKSNAGATNNAFGNNNFVSNNNAFGNNNFVSNNNAFGNRNAGSNNNVFGNNNAGLNNAQLSNVGFMMPFVNNGNNNAGMLGPELIMMNLPVNEPLNMATANSGVINGAPTKNNNNMMLPMPANMSPAKFGSNGGQASSMNTNMVVAMPVDVPTMNIVGSRAPGSNVNNVMISMPLEMPAPVNTGNSAKAGNNIMLPMPVQMPNMNMVSNSGSVTNFANTMVPVQVDMTNMNAAFSGVKGNNGAHGPDCHTANTGSANNGQIHVAVPGNTSGGNTNTPIRY